MIITALFFNDFYRTLVLGFLSVLLTYSIRSSEIKKRIIASCIYLACVVAGFAWVFLFISILNGSPDMEVLFFGIAWSCFFLIITTIQHVIYHLWGKGIELLILNTAIVLVLCFIASKYVIKI